MNEEVYNIALRNALSGIKNSITDLNWSFILTNDGTVVTSDDNPVDPNMTKAASSLQSLAEKANVIGGLDNILINGEKSKVYVSSVNDMYLVAGLDKNADLVYFRTITSAVLPTVLKVLDSVTSSLTHDPTPFRPIPAPSFPPTRSHKPEPLEPTPSEHTYNREQAVEEDETAEAEAEVEAGGDGLLRIEEIAKSSGGFLGLLLVRAGHWFPTCQQNGLPARTDAGTSGTAKDRLFASRYPGISARAGGSELFALPESS